MNVYFRVFLYTPIILTCVVLIPIQGMGQSEPTTTSSQTSISSYIQELEAGNAKQRMETVNHIIQVSPSLTNTYIQMLGQPFSTDHDTQVAMKAFLWSVHYPSHSSNEGKADQKTDSPPADWLQTLITIEEPDWKAALTEMKRKKGLQFIHPDSLPSFTSLRANVLFRVALLRALGEFGTQGNMHVVSPLFDFAFLHQGLFKEECGRILQQIGEYAVPELTKIAYTRYNLEDKKTKAERKGKNLSAQIKYAKGLLDQMDRQTAEKALKRTTSEALKVALLQVYGDIQYHPAVEPVFLYTKDSLPSVRAAARAAFLRYVEGPAPPPSPRRYRKQANGVVETQAKEDFWDFRKLAKVYVQNELIQWKVSFPKTATQKEMTLLLFRFYDDQQKMGGENLFAKGKNAEKLGQLKQAVDIYQWLLSHQPEHPRRKEMVDAFYQYGESLAKQGEQNQDQKTISVAIGYIRKAVILFPQHPNHARMEARYHYLDGKQAQALGGDGKIDFEWALAADPTYQEAAHELAVLKK